VVVKCRPIGLRSTLRVVGAVWHHLPALHDATFIVRHCTARLSALGTQKDPHKKEDGHQGEEQYATHNVEHFHSAVPPQFLKSKYYLGLFARDLPEASLGSYRGLKLGLSRELTLSRLRDVADSEHIVELPVHQHIPRAGLLQLPEGHGSNEGYIQAGFARVVLRSTSRYRRTIVNSC
jgi:hypothetical protein